MAISAEYLEKVRRGVRQSANVETDAEIKDLIEECRADLVALGVLKDKAKDEMDGLILGAVRCFVRWKFGVSNEDAAANREDYMQLRDELRKKESYVL